MNEGEDMQEEAAYGRSVSVPLRGKGSVELERKFIYDSILILHVSVPLRGKGSVEHSLSTIML